MDPHPAPSPAVTASPAASRVQQRSREGSPKRVDFAGDTIEDSPEERAEPGSSRRWLSTTSRVGTDLNEVVVDSRLTRHNKLFRRPRALLYHPVHHPRKPKENHSEAVSSNDARDSEGRSSDNISKQLRRIDLFVDLIWVGIVANLSGTFGEQAFTDSGVSINSAVGEFVLLFFPIWKVWDDLRSYTSHYYMDDILQRFFLVWILVLSVVYGVNAPYAFASDGGATSLKLLIVVYLITRASFAAALAYQCLFIPLLRRQLLFEFFGGAISFGLYIGAIYIGYPEKIALLVLVNAVEQPLAIFQASPLGERLLAPKGMKKVVDIDRYIERYEGFFIILLGEGVFRLIEGSPSGMGINKRSGTVITALMLYYVLHWLYFNGDQSKQFVHALRRTWWKPILWQFYHKVMFASLLFLDASTLYLVQHRSSSPTPTARATSDPSSTSTEEETPETSHYILYALWTASITLAVTIFSMTHVALLNRPLDPPKTLLINSRLLRLAPRVPAMVAILCLPLFKGMNGGTWCGAAIIVCYALFLFESLAGMEREWRVFEAREE